MIVIIGILLAARLNMEKRNTSHTNQISVIIGIMIMRGDI